MSHLVYGGLWVILTTVMVQWIIASGAKAKQAGAVPGKIDETLSHDSFVFRAHRTFHNSLENVPFFIAAAFLAIFVGVDSQWFAISVWAFAFARIVHMLLYYGIATERNPSPRSYFFIIGVIANIVVLVQIAIDLVA
ncbi:MAPEG family protein [Pseudidiomarina gelatinasegens]|jgi:glutathione S-transferase|uniref:MAPEG family protein n=1 Tax=Pseudidiomarina gelatinasegens TaxID=2487740 RepID=A0A451GE67_9GAMM|nr:MAPEG family protein [Pseudidiomarina gelatinasegens]RWU11237.1 MAPEG family protein [Pseudidiomarina gelatinasegens]